MAEPAERPIAPPRPHYLPPPPACTKHDHADARTAPTTPQHRPSTSAAIYSLAPRFPRFRMAALLRGYKKRNEHGDDHENEHEQGLMIVPFRCALADKGSMIVPRRAHRTTGHT